MKGLGGGAFFLFALGNHGLPGDEMMPRGCALASGCGQTLFPFFQIQQNKI